MDFHEAACKGLDPDIFMPLRGEPAEAGKAICRMCPIQVECLQYALDEHINVGTWGGSSQRQRRQIRSLGITAEQAIEQRIVL